MLTAIDRRPLTSFIATHCNHRDYAAEWQRCGDKLMTQAFAAEAGKVEALAPGIGG